MFAIGTVPFEDVFRLLTADIGQIFFGQAGDPRRFAE